jgi:molecular chaperone GrpE
MSETKETLDQSPHNEEVIDYKDKYFRILAEIENMRKRMQKEKLDTMKFAVENVLVDIIEPIDNFENALNFTSQMTEEVKNWAVGFQMILEQFKNILTQNGVVVFVSEGKLFDSGRHEAVEIEESTENPDGLILKEFAKGYSCGERIIRVARVKVAKKITEKKEDDYE